MAGFRWFQVVSDGFRWFQLVPRFSKYDTCSSNIQQNFAEFNKSNNNKKAFTSQL